MTREEAAKKYARLDVLDEVAMAFNMSVPDADAEWRARKAEILALVRWLKQQDTPWLGRDVPPMAVAREREAYARLVNGAASG